MAKAHYDQWPGRKWLIASTVNKKTKYVSTVNKETIIYYKKSSLLLAPTDVFKLFRMGNFWERSFRGGCLWRGLLLRYHSSKVEFFRLFLEEIKGTKNHFETIWPLEGTVLEEGTVENWCNGVVSKIGHCFRKWIDLRIGIIKKCQ